MQNYRNLKVWEKAHAIVLDIYRLTATFPNTEQYGLTSQIRRSAASIPANIAEGSARGSDADFARFLQIALGSTAELDYHLLLAHDLELIETQQYQTIANEIDSLERMLNAFIQQLRRSK
jgi:four helix bundle protein